MQILNLILNFNGHVIVPQTNMCKVQGYSIIIDCIICLYVFIRVYAKTYIKEHLRYLKFCLREANKF